MSERRPLRTYDQRLRNLVRETGDVTIATEVGVPRSTAAGWLRAEAQDVITLDVLDKHELQLQAELVKLRRRVRLLGTVVGLLVALVRVSGRPLDGLRVPEGHGRSILLRAVERARAVLPIRAVLRVLGLTASRFHAWKRALEVCYPAGRISCPRMTPNQLTPEEVFAIREMVTSSEYRHVPTSRLAVLAQRLGKVVASGSTWSRLVRQHGWRRPRQRIHPDKPKVGLRTDRPDEAWHVDTTVIKLLDGTRAYIHAVIDNFSRRILAFRVADRFDISRRSRQQGRQRSRGHRRADAGGRRWRRGEPRVVVPGMRGSAITGGAFRGVRSTCCTSGQTPGDQWAASDKTRPDGRFRCRARPQPSVRWRGARSPQGQLPPGDGPVVDYSSQNVQVELTSSSVQNHERCAGCLSSLLPTTPFESAILRADPGNACTSRGGPPRRE
ncbi:MAG: DDE-type integrase/transposase/recombinase [Deltaproteobacteria bacterium]|jgi:hypothetical protein|nr:DDE-type integrase/transposase/recombinase [Deltaproteobacteria bacterium]MBW2533580.1 DDE-type integrase/transposase/recombinase [Deltaproteobacteria bacterium]